MPAKLVQLGEPAHEKERQAQRALAEGLPSDWTVYSNVFLVERTGVSYELDTVVAAPHGFYVVELKSYANEVSGNDYDWFVPNRIKSPLKLNRQTAQVLRRRISDQSREAGRVWVDHLVFLTHTTAHRLSPTGLCQYHVATQADVIARLKDVEGYKRRAQGGAPPPTEEALKVLEQVLGAAKDLPRPKQIRDWKLETTEVTHERYSEYRAHHALSAKNLCLLRVYPFKGDDDHRVRERCTWESQVLARLGKIQDILSASPPFEIEGGICIPFEHFEGVTLHSWQQRHGQNRGEAGVQFLLGLWRRIAEAIRQAHEQGVVHRLLGDEAILLKDHPAGDDLRITGFDLAKQLTNSPDQTIATSTLADERLLSAAPELLQLGFSAATEATDQWALGVLLGQLLRGRRLFDRTEDWRRNGPTPLLAFRPGIGQALNDVYLRMVDPIPARRYGSVAEALSEVNDALAPRKKAPPSQALDAENLAPQTVVGDYEIIRTLGSGGFATVYEARNRIVDRSQALKVAYNTDTARRSLEEECIVLEGKLDHPNIVRAKGISDQLVPGRRTLILDRIQGEPLSRWLKTRRTASPQELRLIADGLFAALDHMETRGVIHKDLKPDNLLISEGKLTVIDFSLAARSPDELTVGTAVWRDPSMRQWDAESDRYAAALCLFELCTGRHPFDGRPPPPNEAARIDSDEFDNPGLRRFFIQALATQRQARFPSAAAMKKFFFDCFSSVQSPEEAPAVASSPAPAASVAEEERTLRTTGLTGTSVSLLERAGIRTVKELLALSDDQVDAVRGLGRKKREEVLEYLRLLRGRQPLPPPSPNRAVLTELVGDTSPLSKLNLRPAHLKTLNQAGYEYVNQVASASRPELQKLDGFGPATIESVVGILIAHHEAREKVAVSKTQGELWANASQPLEALQRQVLELRYGLYEAPESGGSTATRLNRSQQDISRAEISGLSALDVRLLDGVLDTVEALLNQLGGVERLAVVCEAVSKAFPPSPPMLTEGLVRLVQATHQTRLLLTEADGEHFLHLPFLHATPLQRFLRTARELAGKFPEVEAEATRRELRATLPEYELDPISLATRLQEDLRCAEAELLFQAPLIKKDLSQALDYVFRKLRGELGLEELTERLERIFGPGLLDFSPEELRWAVDRSPKFQVEGDRVVPRGPKQESHLKQASPEVPAYLRLPSLTPDQAATEHLRSLRGTKAFRMVVTPPESHATVGPQLATELGVDFVSFEEAFLVQAEGNFEALEKAERFSALKPRLTQTAEALFDTLLEKHSGPNKTLVLGDTALWQLCGTLHLARRLYDLSTEGNLGLVVLVLPGNYRKQSVYFNDSSQLVFHLDGLVLPLQKVG